MTVVAVVAYVWALGVTVYAIRRVRAVRRQIVANNAREFRAQARRAHQFHQLCGPCKKIVNPSWNPAFKIAVDTGELASAVEIVKRIRGAE